MRRVVLLALCLALPSCGSDDDVESGGCTSAILLHGQGYLGVHLDGRRPPPGSPLDDGIKPACNDGGPPFDDDRDVGLREVSGLPPEVAVYVEGEPDVIYVSDRYHVFLPMPRYRRRARGARCHFAGTVTELEGLRVGRRWVGVDGRTRMEGFPGSLPYLRNGDRVRVDAVGCSGEDVVARRIALQP
jgi:hypothetical protein